MKSASFAWARSPRIMSALGVFAAVVLFVCLNILVRRFYARWDVSDAQIYSLSRVTLDTLDAVDEPLEVIVLLGTNDPVTASARQILESYSAHCRWMRSRFVDPDRSPAEVEALRSRYGLADPAQAEGDWGSATTLLVIKNNRAWKVSAQELMSYDPEAGRVQPTLEQAITTAIRNALQARRQQVCFTRGHQEASIDSAGAEGLAVFRDSLQRNNFEVVEKDFSLTARGEALDSCDLVVVAAPRVAVSGSVVDQLVAHLQGGGHVLLALQPGLTAEGTIEDNGLQRVLSLAGVEARPAVVFETDAELVLPIGVSGELFLATPQSHQVTRLLAGEEGPRYRVLMHTPQALDLTSGGSARVLLTSSDDARRIDEPGRLAEPQAREALLRDGESGRQILGAAAELPAAAGKQPGRVVVLASLAPISDPGLRDAALLGNRLLVDGAVGWLVDAPPPVNVPQKPSHEANLNLTEDSLERVSRYVLLYMPGTALAIGLILLLRRRSLEKQGRQRAQADT